MLTASDCDRGHAIWGAASDILIGDEFDLAGKDG